jgi:hypothetical protein
MAKEDRAAIIEEIEGETKTNCIAYVTSTRNGLEVQMAMDAVRKVYEHLRLIGKPRADVEVSLFLCSNGGDGTVPWRLVTLIREYAERFSVLVPYRAFSAATLTALGADRILMHPMGTLGPTDPTVGNQFNPPDPTKPGQTLGISVEDVTAYINLIKEDAGIRHEDQLVQAFAHLPAQVHPLALGNVKRSLSQSRMMAKKLLGLHMNMAKDEHKMDEIVDKLTSKLFFHGHPINRREAKDEIGLPTIQTPSAALEGLMWDLYVHYEQEMKLEEPFQPAMEFIARCPRLTPNTPTITPATKAKLAYVESIKRSDCCSMDYQLSGVRADNGSTTVNVLVSSQGWATE